MLRRLIDCADLAAPVLVEAAVAAAMVRPYSWLLDRVGDAGIKLTAAGYLPPADVEAAVSELGLGEEWIGKGNRESQTLPVLDLRETAQRAGLLRKYSGRLQLSPRGRAARADPAALWWRLAESLPDAKDDCERQAGLLLLLMLAAGEAADWADMTAGLLTTIGWRTGYGESTHLFRCFSRSLEHALGAAARWRIRLGDSQLPGRRAEPGGYRLRPSSTANLAGRPQ